MDKLQELVLEYMQNKENKKLEEILKLLNPIISKKARQLARVTQTEYEDMKQELYLVILKKLPNYNSERSKFITYLYSIFQGDPTDTMAAKVCKKRGGNGINCYASSISLSSVINESSGEKETTLQDIIADPHDIHQEIEQDDIEGLVKTHGKEKLKNMVKEEQK